MPILNLSKAELDTLKQILLRVGGDPETSRRQYTNTILDKVEDAGGHAYFYGSSRHDLRGELLFRDENNRYPETF